jgi:hypothetical protein
MHTCDTCGKQWPENYCPECARTITREPKRTPPPVPDLSPQPAQPPSLRPAAPRRKKFPSGWVAVALGALLIFGVAALIQHFVKQRFVFPPGYRNRPTSGWHRPGQTEFQRADNQIDSYQGTNAYGNSPEAIAIARHFSDAFKIARAGLFTPGSKLEILDHTKGEFITYCELHSQECAFIVHVPDLRKFEENILEKVDARKLLAQLAWMTAQRVLKEHSGGKPGMELAVGLRGISQYGPIMIGYYDDNAREPKDGLVKYLDDGAQTHYLWTFFAPEGQGRSK